MSLSRVKLSSETSLTRVPLENLLVAIKTSDEDFLVWIRMIWFSIVSGALIRPDKGVPVIFSIRIWFVPDAFVILICRMIPNSGGWFDAQSRVRSPIEQAIGLLSAIRY